MSAEAFQFEVGVISQDRNSTYHLQHFHGYVPPMENQDFAHYQPGVSALVADGWGKAGGAISHLAVGALEQEAKALGISRMPADEAVDATHEALARTDQRVAEYKGDDPALVEAGTTLGGLVFARNRLVVVGIGDTPVFRDGFAPKGGLLVREFQQLTAEQGIQHWLANWIGGLGRPPSARYPRPNVRDQVFAVPMQAGDRFLIASDGLLGDEPQHRMPHSDLAKHIRRSNRADSAAVILANLPTRLAIEKRRVEHGGVLLPYKTKYDDLSVMTVFVFGAQN